MKTKSYTVYSFDELSAKAKVRAIDDHRQFLSESFDASCVEDDAKRFFAFIGFDISKIYWSGFSYQRAGACFEGAWHAASVMPGKLKEEAPQDKELHRIAAAVEAIAVSFPFASLSVEHRGHYYHKYSTAIDSSICDEEGDNIGTPEAQKAEDDLTELSRDAMEWIYRQLEKEYEYETSDENAEDSIAAYQYEFTEDGKID